VLIERVDDPDALAAGPPRPGTRTLVAADLVGAPEGCTVIVSTGSAVRKVMGDAVPVDMAVVGIVDYLVTKAGKVELNGG